MRKNLISVAAATAAKVVNYTDAQVATMASMFTAKNPAVKADAEKLAVTFGKNARSVVAKLSRMGIYQAAEYKTKAGTSPQSKETIADAIGAVLRLTEAETTSLTKAGKTALDKIFKALADSKPLENGENRAGEVAPGQDE